MRVKESTAYDNKVKECFEKIGGNEESLNRLLEKNKKFLIDPKHLGNKVAAELRFCFYGQVIPYEIEDDIKTLSRSFSSLSMPETLIRNDKKLLRVDNVVSENNGTKKKIIFTNYKHQKKEVLIERKVDTSRGELQSTSIEYKGRTYKVVRDHGDVGNHSLSQAVTADRDIFLPMVKTGMMGPLDRLARMNYFFLHDMTEAYEKGKGDIFVDLKEKDDNDNLKEEEVLRIMQSKDDYYTPHEIKFNMELVSFMEGEKINFDGAIERIYYNVAALYMYEDHQFHNSGILAGADVIANQMRHFLNEDYLVHFPKLIDSEGMKPIPLARMPGSKYFFMKNEKIISKLVDEIKNNFKNLPLEGRRFFNKNKTLPYTINKEFKNKFPEKRHLKLNSRSKVNSLYSDREKLQTYYSNLRVI